MRIAITGNLGYVGPVVVEHLAGTGHHELTGFDAGYFASRLADTQAIPERLLHRQRYVDIRDVAREDLRGIDAVIHLAALSNDPLGNQYEALTAEINRRATLRLAQLAREAGVRRFLFASSCSVYGETNEEFVNEDSTVNPLTAYAASKLQSERDLRALASPDFVITCLRFATAYGWSPRLRLDLVLNDFAASATATGEIVLSSTGEAWRPLIHVRDMARTLEWGLIRPPDDPYLCCNAGATASNWRILDLANAVAGALDGVTVRKPEAAPADRRSYRVDFADFERRAAGHTPRESLAAAAVELAQGLRRLGYGSKHRSRYVRLDTLRELQRGALLDDDLRWRVPARCRLCSAALAEMVADLGRTPLANDYPPPSQTGPDPAFPLDVWVCTRCWLVQLRHLVPPETIFRDYAYLSSCSPSWVEHARQFSELARRRLGLSPNSRVVEIASNDGYLLQHFVQAGIPSLGVEPAGNVASIARERGVETVAQFFTAETARTLVSRDWRADLIVANNVLAHVTDLHGFVEGFHVLLQPDGAATFEFPHVLELIRQNQFDTIYHEHYSYFSLLAAEKLFALHQLRIFDVERLATHGGSLRLWVCQEECSRFPTSGSVSALLAEERRARLDSLDGYTSVSSRAERCRNSLTVLLNRLHAEGKSVAAYGAAAKGNTLLNYCGIGADRISFVADRNPLKQGRCLPGSRIPIVDPEEIGRRKPDYLLILPWNLTSEIQSQMALIRDWGGRFIRPVPEAEELV